MRFPTAHPNLVFALSLVLMPVVLIGLPVLGAWLIYKAWALDALYLK